MVTRIRQLLEQKQLTPTQFADAIGVGRPVMSHILSERNKPSLEVVQRIIEAFPDVSMPWLLKGVGEMLESDAKSRPAANVSSSPTELEVPAPAAIAPVEPAAVPDELVAPASPSLAPTVAVAPAAPELATVAKIQEKEVGVPPVVPATVSAPSAGLATTVSSVRPESPAAPTAPAPKPFVASRFVRPGASTPAVAPLATPSPVAAPVSTPVPSPVAPLPFSPTAAPALTAAAVPAPATAIAPAAPASVSLGADLLPFLNDSGKAIRRIVIFYRDGSFADYQPEQ